MSRRSRVSLVVLPAVAVAGALAAILSGMPWSVAVMAAVCAAAGVAGLSLAATGETVHWSSPLGRDRTSAGWHDVRILAETLAAARTDPAARRQLITRVQLALDMVPPAGARPQGAGRREYEQALALLRARGAHR